MITQTFYVDTVYPVVLIGLLVAFMPWISELIMGEPGYALYFDLALASLFLVNINDIPMQLFRLDHRPKTFAFWTIARVFVQVPVNVVFVAVFHWGVLGVLTGNLIATAVLFVCCLQYWVGRLRFSWEPALLKEMTAFAFANFFANLSFYVLNFSDRYLLRRSATWVTSVSTRSPFSSRRRSTSPATPSVWHGRSGTTRSSKTRRSTSCASPAATPTSRS